MENAEIFLLYCKLYNIDYVKFTAVNYKQKVSFLFCKENII